MISIAIGASSVAPKTQTLHECDALWIPKLKEE